MIAPIASVGRCRGHQQRYVSAGGWLLAAAWLAPTQVWAHAGASPAMLDGIGAEVWSGFVHPLTGVDHLLAITALGMWSALTARRPWLAPLAFTLALMLGVWGGHVLAGAGVAVPAVEPMVASSVLVLGLLLAGRTPLPDVAAVSLAAVFALFHGAAHGLSLSGAALAWSTAGLLAATLVLQAAAIGLVRAMHGRHPWIHRAAGTLTAAAGVFLLAQLT